MKLCFFTANVASSAHMLKTSTYRQQSGIQLFVTKAVSSLRCQDVQVQRQNCGQEKGNGGRGVPQAQDLPHEDHRLQWSLGGRPRPSKVRQPVSNSSDV